MKGLIDSYSNLVAMADVRTLLKSVVQDAQNETVSFAESRPAVLNAFLSIQDMGMRTKVRLGIIGYLNEVMYEMYPGYSLRITSYDQRNIWLWENHTRLMKFLVVSMVLESENLKSFGATPTKDDIPQALIRVYKVIQHGRQSGLFDLMKEEYRKTTHYISITPEGSGYITLYVEK